MQMNTRPQDVLAVSRWLTTEDLEPSGRELLVAMKMEQGSPYTFFVTRKSEEGKPPRFFASWVHEAVLVDSATLRKGINGRDLPADSASDAKSRLRGMVSEVLGTDEGFDDAWTEAAKLIRAMQERELIQH